MTEIIELTAPPKRRTGLLLWMIVSQLLAVGSLAIWALVAGLSVMAFDEGSSPEAWRFVITVWAYPLFPLLLALAHGLPLPFVRTGWQQRLAG